MLVWFDPAARTLALRILSASLETKGLEAPVTGEQQIRQSLACLLPTRLLGFDDIGSEEGVAVASACGAKVNGHGHDGLVVENALAREVGRRAQRSLPAHRSFTAFPGNEAYTREATLDDNERTLSEVLRKKNLFI